ncbi:MAG: type VII toxin-antitoxin system HepT family RNase toxin [Candidatus Jordarchaeum sp.]|uniref:type VII toxin-antitoxin system HepT family RNase toxin n=1 Tax=Candidatus Jordarchaeum sp. TaxID=2823881 RepID=UPI00404AEE53
MEVDRNLIEGKIDIIERNIKFLEQYKDSKIKEFEKNYKDIQAVKYSLLEIIEFCIDIANHIISVSGYRRAETYSEIFQILGEEKVISQGLSEKMQNMAKFRNLLVHRYGEIENRKLLEIIKKNLDDVKEFEKEIEKNILE